MNCRLGLTLFTSALMVAVLAAQDDPPASKKVNGDKKVEAKKPQFKELEKREPMPEAAGGEDPARLKKIVERLHKNMDASEERLGKKDPGDETRKIQGDIIKDLDELIKQQSKGGGGGGGASSSSSSSSSASKSGRTSSSRSQAKSGQNKGGQANPGGSKQGADKKDNPASAKKDQKEGPDKVGKGGDKDKGKGEQSAKSEPGKDGKGGDATGGNVSARDKKDKNTIGDLFKDVWGHLPLSKRQEMDAYSKERFLEKYDQILRQYYRTISEQGRRKDGE